MTKTKFYYFRQCNSGGKFTEPAVAVVIEAEDAEDANRRARSQGLLLDEVGPDDCSHCGSRWDSITEDETFDMIEFDETPEPTSTYDRDGVADMVVYYTNGQVAWGRGIYGKYS